MTAAILALRVLLLAFVGIAIIWPLLARGSIGAALVAVLLLGALACAATPLDE